MSHRRSAGKRPAFGTTGTEDEVGGERGSRRRKMPRGWTWAERLAKLPAQLDMLIGGGSVVPMLPGTRALIDGTSALKS